MLSNVVHTTWKDSVTSYLVELNYFGDCRKIVYMCILLERCDAIVNCIRASMTSLELC